MCERDNLLLDELTHLEKRNDWTKRNLIPIGTDRNGKPVSFTVPTHACIIVVLGVRRTRKTTLTKTITYYLTTQYGIPGVIFDFKGTDFYAALQPIQQQFRYQLLESERPDGINAVPFAPSYVDRDTLPSEFKKFSLNVTQFTSNADWEALGLKSDLINAILEETKKDVRMSSLQLLEKIKHLSTSGNDEGIAQAWSARSSAVRKLYYAIERGLFDPTMPELNVAEVWAKKKSVLVGFFNQPDELVNPVLGKVMDSVLDVVKATHQKHVLVLDDAFRYMRTGNLGSEKVINYVKLAGYRGGILIIVAHSPSDVAPNEDRSIVDSANFYFISRLGGEGYEYCARLGFSAYVMEQLRTLTVDPKRGQEWLMVHEDKQTCFRFFPKVPPCGLELEPGGARG